MTTKCNEWSWILGLDFGLGFKKKTKQKKTLKDIVGTIAKFEYELWIR